jgi:hypothetical protein
MSKEIVQITKLGLLNKLRSLGKTVVSTKSTKKDLSGNFRQDPENKERMLNGYWPGIPSRVEKGLDYAAHFIAYSGELWIGKYYDCILDKPTRGRYSIVMEHPVLYKITDMDEPSSADSALLKNFLRKPGVVNYSYFSGGSETEVEMPEGNLKPKRFDRTISDYERDTTVKAWVLQQADGKCECCNATVPALFIMAESKQPYLEVHHVVPLANDGPDTPANTVAICPSCHRELHFGENKDALCDILYQKVQRLKKPGI